MPNVILGFVVYFFTVPTYVRKIRKLHTNKALLYCVFLVGLFFLNLDVAFDDQIFVIHHAQCLNDVLDLETFLA